MKEMKAVEVKLEMTATVLEELSVQGTEHWWWG